MTYHQMYDKDIHAVWTDSNKIHLAFMCPTEETILTKEDLIMLLDRLENNCKVPPVGWVCSRENSHCGPCAARQSEEGRD